MHPNFLRNNHNPEFKDALPPVSSRLLDGTATNAITRQLERLEEQVGNVNEARFPVEELPEGETAPPLYGYDFKLSDNTAVRIQIDVDPRTGEPVGEDREFVKARNRLAVLHSREGSRGSRLFNFAFRKDRGRGPGGHGYNAEGVESIEAQYKEEFSKFVGRKLENHSGVDSADKASEASGLATIQEQVQMSALRRMAAEQKNGNRFLSFMRRHKKTRMAVGVALAGIGMLGVATGQLEIAAPALAAGTALRGTGGYIFTRTLWDGVQGWRTRRKPEEDIRMASHRNGDFSGEIEDPEIAFKRFIRINGAEARAGSTDPRRQKLAYELSGLVKRHYMDKLSFSGTPSATDIADQIRSLHGSTINDYEQERLKSDQTQSRRRHIAGLVGGAAMAALPFSRLVGLLEVSGVHPSGISNHLPFVGGSSHEAAANVAHSSQDAPANIADQASNSGSSGNGVMDKIAGIFGEKNGILGSHNAHGMHGAYGDMPNGSNVITSPGHPDVTIIDGPGNDTYVLTAFHQHADQLHHLNAHHLLHETIDGLTTNQLHVEPGGGFISTLQEQYDLSPAQADAVYHDMYPHLLHAPGTYMYGSDIRISAPGDFKLPEGARQVLENHLKALHEMAHPEPITEAAADPQTGGIIAPESAAEHGAHLGAATGTADGGLTAPDTAIGIGQAYEVGTGYVSSTGGVAAPGLSYIDAAQLAHNHNMPMPPYDYFTSESPVDPANARHAFHMLNQLRLAYGHELHALATDAEDEEEALVGAITGITK